jgi:hypothetical protein
MASLDPELRAGDADRDRAIAVLPQVTPKAVCLTKSAGHLLILPMRHGNSAHEVPWLLIHLSLGVATMVNKIWGATWIIKGDGTPCYWPIWVMKPWGSELLIATINDPRKRD